MTGFEPRTSEWEATALPTEPQPLPFHMREFALESMQGKVMYLTII